jgi:hypothetical protein
MEPIILQSPNVHSVIEAIDEQLPIKTGSSRPRLRSFSSSRDETISWGRRAHHGSGLHALGCATIMILCPLLVIFYSATLEFFEGSMSDALQTLLNIGPFPFYRTYSPSPSFKVCIFSGKFHAPNHDFNGRTNLCSGGAVLCRVAGFSALPLPDTSQQDKHRPAHTSWKSSKIPHEWPASLDSHSPYLRPFSMEIWS